MDEIYTMLGPTDKIQQQNYMFYFSYPVPGLGLAPVE